MTDITELLQQIKNLEMGAKGMAEGMESGTYKTKLRGGGIEFSRIREYTAGDDARRIDWNVSARYNELFVKEFVEEKDLDIHVIMDVSASNDFGFVKSKKELALEVSASLMFSALKNNDRVGMGLFTDTLEKFIPAKKGKRHVMKILKEMLVHENKNNNTDIGRSLAELQRHLKRKSVIYVISDFISDSFERPLKHLRQRHQIVLISISDIHETMIPDIGNVYLEDTETGEQILVNTSDSEFQKKYHSLIKKTSENIQRHSKRMGIDCINLTNEEPFDIVFNRHIKSKTGRKT